MASSIAASHNIAIAGVIHGCARLGRGRGRSAVAPPIRAVSTTSEGPSLESLISDIASVPGASGSKKKWAVVD